MDTVPFCKESVLEHLDKCIINWREFGKDNPSLREMASHYVDAYQSVRVSLFGEILM